MTTLLNKKIYIGNLKHEGYERRHKAFITIELKQENEQIKLSMVGSCIVGSGQCYKEIRESLNNADFSKADISKIDVIKLLDIWQKYHLNDMNAGTPRQSKFLEETKSQHNYDYKKCCQLLEENNLLFDKEYDTSKYGDKGYKYGSDWLYREIPKEVIDYVMTIREIEQPNKRENEYMSDILKDIRISVSSRIFPTPPSWATNEHVTKELTLSYSKSKSCAYVFLYTYNKNRKLNYNDVMSSLLSDYQVLQNCQGALDLVEDFGYSAKEARGVYKALQLNKINLELLFTKEELEILQEDFQGY